MNTRRSNRMITYIILVIGIIGALVVSNVLFTIVTGVHLRSGENIKAAYSGSEYERKEIVAKRGEIKDRNGQVIAQDMDTYTLVAYMNENRKDGNKAAYVKNREQTAEKLAPILEVDASSLLETLDYAAENHLYQTEFGISGKNLSAAKKEQIESLDLPGLDFTTSSQRYYPSGKFASSLIGYANYNNEQGKIIGEMGLEMFLDKELQGSNGSVRYKQDAYGTILSNTKYVEKQAVNGYDVFLTLDKNVQLALESALEKTINNFHGQKAWAIVMEVETGKILGWAGSPTFDLNEKNITDYQNLPSQYTYEPGSTMKVFTYAAAIDTGVYNTQHTFPSGTFYWNYNNTDGIYRDTSQHGEQYSPISDALGRNFGIINYDQGLIYSANTAICDLIANYLDPSVLEEYLDKFGFFKAVNVYGISENTGTKTFQYPIEQLSTGFGQASSTTALQLAQAYTAVFNEGTMLKPYYIDKIVDSSSNKVIYQGAKEELGTPIKAETAAQLVELMDQVVNVEGGSGRRYKMEDVRVIAKTGTGEIWDPLNNRYRSDLYVNSVMAAAPKEDPKIMMYYAFESGDIITFNGDYFKEAFREALVAENVAGTTGETTPNQGQVASDWKEYDMPSLVNHTLDYAARKMEGMNVNRIVIGDGGSIVKQFPSYKEKIITNQNIFLLTDGNTIKMPNMIGWTRKDVATFWDLSGIPIQIAGSGTVAEQSVPPDTVINVESKIEVKLK